MTRIWSSLVVHEKITIFLLSNIFIVKITDTSYIPRVRPYNDRPPKLMGLVYGMDIRLVMDWSRFNTWC